MAPSDIDWATLSNEQRALGYLREARAAMCAARDDDKRGTRDLSVAFTETETAIFWLQRDVSSKAPIESVSFTKAAATAANGE